MVITTLNLITNQTDYYFIINRFFFSKKSVGKK